jgi:hypothetical protein
VGRRPEVVARGLPAPCPSGSRARAPTTPTSSSPAGPARAVSRCHKTPWIEILIAVVVADTSLQMISRLQGSA